MMRMFRKYYDQDGNLNEDAIVKSPLFWIIAIPRMIVRLIVAIVLWPITIMRMALVYHCIKKKRIFKRLFKGKSMKTWALSFFSRVIYTPSYRK